VVRRQRDEVVAEVELGEPEAVAVVEVAAVLRRVDDEPPHRRDGVDREEHESDERDQLLGVAAATAASAPDGQGRVCNERGRLLLEESAHDVAFELVNL
jgi:hypothetical protein